MLQVRQEATFIVIDYHPDEKDFWQRYSAQKGWDFETLQVKPAEITITQATSKGTDQGLKETIYLSAMLHLAYQLDQLIKTREDLQRKLVINQVGLHFEAGLMPAWAKDSGSNQAEAACLCDQGDWRPGPWHKQDCPKYDPGFE